MLYFCLFSPLFLQYEGGLRLKQLKLNQKEKKEQGFTLVELLIVLFIIGVLMSIVVPNIRAAGEKAQLRACLANQKLIHVQMENYYLENGEYPPVSVIIEGTISTEGDFLNVLYEENYLDSVPSCPVISGKYHYEIDADTDKLIIWCEHHNNPLTTTETSE